MRRIVSGITAFMLVLCSLAMLFTFSMSAAQISSGSCGNGVNWVLNDSGTLTISGNGAMHDFDRTSSPWYNNRYMISKIVIAKGVTSVGSYAFYDCTGVSEVVLDDSVAHIGDHAFWGCEALADISLGGAVTIEQNAFLECVSLVSVSLPSSVIKIDPYAFQNCSSLKEINVDENNAFFTSLDGVLYNKDMSALLLYPASKEGNSYDVPSSVKRIGKLAFANSMLEVIGISSGVSIVEFGAFFGCTELTDINVSAESPYLSSVEGVLFGKNKKVLIAYPAASSVQDYNVPAGVAHIGDGAFYGCRYLSNVVIPDGVSYIGHSAFSDCTSLKTVELPGSLKELSDWSFSGCAELEALTFNGTYKTWNKINKASSWASLSGTDTENGTFEVVFTNFTFSASSSGLCGDRLTWSIDWAGNLMISGTGAMYDYKPDSVIAPPWNDRKDEINTVIIGDGVTSVGGYAFDACVNLTSVSIADSVIYIGENAFGACTSLANAVLPVGLNYLHPLSFRDCSSLSDVYIDESNAYFSALDGVLFNKDRTELLLYPKGMAENAYVIPESVSVIAPQAFSYSMLSIVNIPSGVSLIDMNAFFGTDMLSTVRFIGSERQWNSVVKGEHWDTYAGAYTASGTYELVFVSADDVIYGDANGDGTVDNKDLVRIKKYIAGFDFDTGVSSETVNGGADANGDGIIDNKDLVRLKKYLASYDYDTGMSDVVLGPIADV